MGSCRSLPPTPTAVAHPCDQRSLEGGVDAARLGLISPILIGPRSRIEATATQYAIDIVELPIVDAPLHRRLRRRRLYLSPTEARPSAEPLSLPLAFALNLRNDAHLADRVMPSLPGVGLDHGIGPRYRPCGHRLAIELSLGSAFNKGTVSSKSGRHGTN